ncbi:hypothetical protein [Sulfitobacter sp.]|uniref:hypothetical protein n=1 Tax=Sulfitobacter sp. TaxID=1903071 RepID=UPI003001477B
MLRSKATGSWSSDAAHELAMLGLGSTLLDQSAELPQFIRGHDLRAAGNNRLAATMSLMAIAIAWFIYLIPTSAI